ncbi:MAG: DNA topoisomerase III [Lachnospiraceae bacterium]|nr:DNA topoisomerase III [Lachnospiraceae bacterium]
MGKVLVIAEKPSVGWDIAKALRVTGQGQKGGYIENDQYIITWAIGHLIGLKYPEEHNPAYKVWKREDLPFAFPLSESLKVLPDTAAQFKVIKTLINRADVDYLVNAGDAGREGLLIQEWIYRMAGNKKPIKMLWISSFTEEAVRQAFASGLKERKDFMGLLNEAEARAQGDHLLGINYSRLLTLTRAEQGTSLSYGRCQTPLLHIIVKRDEEIARFKPMPYFNISITYKKGFKGLLVDENGNRIDFTDRTEAESVLNRLSASATVLSYTEEEKAKKAPLLYNLAALQKVMGSKYGYTPDQTLAIAQALYEKHKILSYPRTDSQCLSTDLYQEINQHLQCCKFGRFGAFVDRINTDAMQLQKRYFNDLKVSDHHALIPTIQPDMAERYANLTDEEKNVFDAVVSSFIAIFLPEYKYSMTEIATEISGYRFISKGITILSLGYKEVLKIDPESGEGEEKDEKQILPKLEEGAAIAVDSREIQDKMTKAPGRYTIAGLIAVMEKHNIGTSATRAEIVKKLLNPKRAFIVLEKGKYASTELGRRLVAIVPDNLKDVALTEHFEEDLKKVNMGSITQEEFLGALLTDLKANIERFSASDGERIGNVRESVGACPLCYKAVMETAKAYGCSGYKEGCKFVIWKTIAGKTISKQQAQQLLTKGCTAKLKGFTGKKGKFDAALLLKPDGTIGFQFDNKGSKKS